MRVYIDVCVVSLVDSCISLSIYTRLQFARMVNPTDLYIRAVVVQETISPISLSGVIRYAVPDVKRGSCDV